VVGAFGRPEVRKTEPRICLYDTDKTDRRDQTIPQNQLSSDEDIPLSPLNPMPDRSGLRRPSHCLSIDAQYPRRGKPSADLLFDPFRTLSDRLQPRSATGGAEIGYRIRRPAIVTRQQVFLPRIGEGDGTRCTARHHPTVPTNQGPGITFSVEKQEHAGVTTQGLTDGLVQERAQDSDAILAAKISHFYLGYISRIGRRHEQMVPGFHTQGLERYMRRGDDQERPFRLCSHPGHLSRVVPRFLGLLESRIFLAIDPNQADIRERKEDTGSGANDN